MNSLKVAYDLSLFEIWKSHLVGKGPAPRAALTGADINCNISDKVGPNQKTTKSRTHSAKYLLRQGAYIENWNSPGCELSELYGHKSPRSLSPSPHLSGFLVDSGASTHQEAGVERAFRFPGKSPTLPAGFPCSSTTTSSSSSKIIHSFDLNNLKSSPVLADFTQLVMKDLQQVGYHSNNPSSAVSACTFWDLPVNLAPFRQSTTAVDTLLASPSGGSQEWETIDGPGQGTRSQHIAVPLRMSPCAAATVDTLTSSGSQGAISENYAPGRGSRSQHSALSPRQS